MSATEYDIIVIGAGVAGAAFAAHAGSLKRRVLLVERSSWPRQKVCGCCLNSAAVESLGRLGLQEQLHREATTIDRVRIRSRGRNADLARPSGLALSRQTLDALLVQQATTSGVEFRSNTNAVILNEQTGPKDHRSVRLRNADHEQLVHAPLVIAADGLSGGSLNELPTFQQHTSNRSWFGLSTTLTHRDHPSIPPGTITMNIARRGYAGIVRLDAQTIHLAAALDPTWTKHIGGPIPAITAVLAEAGADPLNLTTATIRGTGLLTRHRNRVSAPGLLVIGDAAGYIEPFTGEGMAWSLASAEAASEMIAARLSGRALAEEWARWYTSNLRSRQRTCTLIRHLLRRPHAVNAALVLMNAFPAITRAAGHIAQRLERPYAQPSLRAATGAVA